MTDINKAFKVIANDFVFHFNEQEILAADLLQKTATELNCIIDHCSINAVVLETDPTHKKIKMAMNGDIFSIEIKDQLDQLLEEMSLATAVHKHLENIKSPMPGLVLEISATEGQQLNEGDKILILEAMKMENSIVMPANATIQKILVSKGQAVEKGQVLVELGHSK